VHRTIEELMVLANSSVARFIALRGSESNTTSSNTSTSSSSSDGPRCVSLPVEPLCCHLSSCGSTLSLSVAVSCRRSHGHPVCSLLKQCRRAAHVCRPRGRGGGPPSHPPAAVARSPEGGVPLPSPPLPSLPRPAPSPLPPRLTIPIRR
jgi:hypothetical protein